MFAIIVQVSEHWFVPYEPADDGKGTTDRQCIYPSLALAEKVAEILKAKRPKGYKQIKIVAERSNNG